MARTDHTTTVTTHEDPAAPHGITTWYAWTCTCGAGDTGMGRTWANDLARAHEERTAPCACAHPTIALPASGPWIPTTARATCDCGYSAHITCDRITVHQGGIGVLIARARLDLARHRCMSRACHSIAGEDVTTERAAVSA